MSKVRLSKKLHLKFSRMNNKVSGAIIKAATVGVKEGSLKKNHPDYLSMKDEQITFINKKSIGDLKSPFHAKKKRQSTRPSKIVNNLFTKEFKEEYGIIEKDVDAFLTEWRSREDTKGDRIVRLKGRDILKAFNYTHELHGYVDSSCAHFYTSNHDKVKMEEDLDFYTENPNVSAYVVYSKQGGVDKIVARMIVFEGEQLYEGYKKVPKGTPCEIYMNTFGFKGEYKQMLINFAKKKKMFSYSGGDKIVLSINTRFTPYPPMDGCYVNFQTNVISTYSSLIENNGGYSDTYHIKPDLKKYGAPVPYVSPE